MDIRNNNEEFFVEGVFYSPHYQGLAYRGRNYEGKTGMNAVKIVIALASLIEIPGESKMGLYGLESGEVLPF